MALSPGDRLGPYEIVSPIGKGGMGEVFRARDTRLKREVALKVLPDAFARDPDRMARFQREAVILASLNHPNIAHIYGVEDRALAMELVEGESPRGPMPFEEGWRIALQIADALEYAHARGVIHRDLKPANVKVTPEGIVKLLDFGLAKALREPGADRGGDSSLAETVTMGVTETGVVVGTAAYMAPEQATAGSVDQRADIWAWGVVLYELLTGKRLFKGANEPDTLRRILSENPDLSDAPPPVQRLLRRCLGKQPNQRLRDIGDARFFLDDPGTAHTTGPPQTRTNALLPAVVCAICAVVLGIGFWRLARQPAAPDMSQYDFQPFATEDYAERDPVFSPDGKTIAYSANPPGGSELRVRSLDGSPPLTLVVGKAKPGALGINQPAWTPDGSTIYYIDADAINVGPVFSVSRAGGEPVRVYDRPVFAISLSRDGQTLAMLTKQENGPGRVLSLSSPPGAPPKQLVELPPSAVQHRIAWSPDGSKILVWLQSPDATPTSSIWLVNATNGEKKKIATPWDTIWLNFSWFPDSRRVALSWPRGDPVEDRSDLAILDTATGAHTLVMPSSEDIGDPSVSPDGKTIAFQTGRLDFDITELPLDGSPPRPMVATKQWEDSADWMQSAPQYVYVSGESIWLRGPNGPGGAMESRPVVSLSAFGGERFRFSSPSLSPDGKKVAYITNLARGTNVWISPLSGGSPAPVGDLRVVTGLTWSPDGLWISMNYATDALTESRLIKVRVGSNQPVELAHEGCASAPAWSPDSRKILCSKGEELYIIPSDPVEGTQQTFLGKQYEPTGAWSRDGRFLYVIRRQGDKRELGKLDLHTSNFQPILPIPVEWTFGPVNLGSERFSLSPDGKSLAATLAKQTGDLWILRGFQGPPSLWRRLFGLTVLKF